MANVRHLNCPQCGAPFTSQWPKNRKFCSKQCTQADWRDRHREQINEYSRQRRKTAPEIRSAINKKYHASPKGQEKSKEWQKKNWPKTLARLRRLYKIDLHYRALLHSRQAAHAMLKRAKHIPYVCEGCGSTERLHAHHQNFNPLENRLDNLMWLCRQCHTELHRQNRFNSALPSGSVDSK